MTPSAKRGRRVDERVGLRALLALAGVLLAAAILAVLVVFARSKTGAVHDLDFDTADDLNRYLTSHHGQVGMWKTITAAGGPTTWRVLAVITVIALSVRRRWRLAGLVAVTMAGAAVLSGVTKLLVHRARPIVTVPVERVGGGSFPSGHALTSVVAVGLTLVLLLPVIGRRWRLLLASAGVVVVASVGFSRLILGVHYVTDVLGGWLIGVLWLAAVVTIFRRTEGGPRRVRR